MKKYVDTVKMSCNQMRVEKTLERKNGIKTYYTFLKFKVVSGSHAVWYPHSILSGGFYCCGRTTGLKQVQGEKVYFRLLFTALLKEKCGTHGGNLEGGLETAGVEGLCLLACSACFHKASQTARPTVAASTISQENARLEIWLSG